MNRDRIIRMICAAQESTGIDPEADKWRWLTAAWQTIVARVKYHSAAGRTNQANAWREAADFFCARYEGEFTP